MRPRQLGAVREEAPGARLHGEGERLLAGLLQLLRAHVPGVQQQDHVEIEQVLDLGRHGLAPRPPAGLNCVGEAW